MRSSDQGAGGNKQVRGRKRIIAQSKSRRNVAANITQKSSTSECKHCMEVEIRISLGSSGQSLPRCDGSRSQNTVGSDKTEKHTQKAL